MNHLIFKDPLWLLALLALPLIVWVRGRRRVPVLLVPFAAAWHRPSLAGVSRWPVVMGLSGVVLLIVALARPQRIEDKREVHSQGFDIMLAVDLSGSMRAEDYEKGGERINRLQAVKPVIQAFIEQRPADRIGIVLFSGKAYTMAPLTFDHDWLAKQLERVRLGMIEDGTAIGDGIGVALTRLEQAKRDAGGKRMGAFVVLLTDGANNRGALTPQQASDLAKARGIPVYTIGAGKDGYVPMPVDDGSGHKRYRMWLSDLDEGALREIAQQTGGAFFRAADNDTIAAAFKAIDKAQKIEFQAQSYLITTELFWWLAVPGLAVLIAAALLARPPGWTRSKNVGGVPSPRGKAMRGEGTSPTATPPVLSANPGVSP
jgi:Ca-activated chloride channel homolog